jgi:Holliday junction resolvasome RuvABC endonuclease subunit
MLLIGVDPAMSGAAGMALVNPDHNPPILRLATLAYKKGSHDQRFNQLWAFLNDTAGRWLNDPAIAEIGSIGAVCIEGVFMRTNVNTTVMLAECVGLARGFAYRNGWKTVVTNPADTRRMLTRIHPALFRAPLNNGAVPREDEDHAMCAAAVAFNGYNALKTAELRATAKKRRKAT